MTTTTDLTPFIPQVLEDAADLLLVHGVRRDGQSGYPTHLNGEEGPLCAFGAMCVAADNIALSHGLSQKACLDDVALDAFEDTHFGTSSGSIQTFPWNDDSADDFEVIDALRHAAKDIRNKTVLEDYKDSALPTRSDGPLTNLE